MLLLLCVVVDDVADVVVCCCCCSLLIFVVGDVRGRSLCLAVVGTNVVVDAFFVFVVGSAAVDVG